ncbi:MAG: hypothetical protein IJY82_02210 [Oscillospiraceae bacterium]|nr:hypothetical protein [Oscillospiraceae bacterium]
MEQKDSFRFTYSAKDREEIKAIRDKYTPREITEDKMTQLRRLDAGATKKATVMALAVGIFGALLLGSGMSLVMTELGNAMGLTPDLTMVLGIPVGVLGILLVSIAYPIYHSVLRKERERIAPEVIRLTDELMQ